MYQRIKDFRTFVQEMMRVLAQGSTPTRISEFNLEFLRILRCSFKDLKHFPNIVSTLWIALYNLSLDWFEEPCRNPHCLHHQNISNSKSRNVARNCHPHIKMSISVSGVANLLWNSPAVVMLPSLCGKSPGVRTIHGPSIAWYGDLDKIPSNNSDILPFGKRLQFANWKDPPCC